MESRWLLKDLPDAPQVRLLAGALNVDDTLAGLLVQRGVTSFDQARNFFRPQLDALPDPFCMRDMEVAVARLNTAQERSEQILIYGDYDVDGTTAVALVTGFLRRFFPAVDYYLPDRHREGYGLSQAGVDHAVATGATLLITLDCGIKAVDNVAYARRQGVDVIICDHHEPGAVLPDAVAILDPKRHDCPYPHSNLSGCGVGFKLMWAYCLHHQVPTEALLPSLDLVAVSIAADLVPIVGENRILAYYGLQQLCRQPRPGLRALLEVAGLEPQEDGTYNLDISKVVFVIGPRLNAAGRVAHARTAVELLLAQTDDEARPAARQLQALNETRRGHDQSNTHHALRMIADDPALRDAPATVLFHADWHQGVAGIVASRCLGSYYRPTVILTQGDDGALTGSARSVENFDLYAAVASCADLLDRFGGHTQAAGLRLAPDKLVDFRTRFNAVVAATLLPEQSVRQIDVDCELTLSHISGRFFRVLRQFGPFGPGNMQPHFVARGLTDAGCAPVGRAEPPAHLRICVRQHNGPVIKGIGFGLAHHYPRIAAGEPFDLCFTLEEESFRGQKTVRLNVKDVRFKPAAGPSD